MAGKKSILSRVAEILFGDAKRKPSRLHKRVYRVEELEARELLSAVGFTDTEDNIGEIGSGYFLLGQNNFSNDLESLAVAYAPFLAGYDSIASEQFGEFPVGVNNLQIPIPTGSPSVPAAQETFLVSATVFADGDWSYSETTSYIYNTSASDNSSLGGYNYTLTASLVDNVYRSSFSITASNFTAGNHATGSIAVEKQYDHAESVTVFWNGNSNGDWTFASVEGSGGGSYDYFYHTDTTTAYSRAVSPILVTGEQTSQTEQTRNEIWNVNYVFVNGKVVRESGGIIVETYNTSSDYSGSGSLEQNTATTTNTYGNVSFFSLGGAGGPSSSCGYTGTFTNTSERTYRLDESGSQSNQETVVTSWSNQANPSGNLVYSASAIATITSSADAGYTYQSHTYNSSSLDGEVDTHRSYGSSNASYGYSYSHDVTGTVTDFSESGRDVFITESFSQSVTEILTAQTGVNSGRFVQTSIDGSASASGTSYSNTFSSSDYVCDLDYTEVSADYSTSGYYSSTVTEHHGASLDVRYSDNNSTSTASYDASVEWGENAHGIQNHITGSGTSDSGSGEASSTYYYIEGSWTSIYGSGGDMSVYDFGFSNTASSHRVTIAPYDKTVSTTGFDARQVAAVSTRFSGLSANPSVSHNISVSITSAQAPGALSYYYSYYMGASPGSCNSIGSNSVSELTFGQSDFSNYEAVDAEARLKAINAQRETPPPTPIVPPNSTPANGISPPIQSGSPLWAGTKAFFGSLGTSFYDIGNHFSLGNIDRERYTEQNDAYGNRLYNISKNLGYSDESIASGLGLAQTLAGEIVGTNGLAEGVVGYDLGTNTLLDGEERFGKIATGTGQIAGTLAGGLKIAGIDPKLTGTTNKTFVDMMSREEAARYRKYWNDAYYNKKPNDIPQNTPGIPFLRRTQLSTDGRYTYEAITYFDEFGRRRAETHYTTHPSTGTMHPNPHYHLYDSITGRKYRLMI